MAYKKIILISIVILAFVLAGCTSKEPVTAGSENNGVVPGNSQTQGNSKTTDNTAPLSDNAPQTASDDSEPNNNAVATLCKAQEIMESKAFAIGDDDIDFCSTHTFDGLIEGVYLSVEKDTFEKNQQKTGKELYTEVINNPDLRNIQVYLKINPSNQVDGFLPGNLPNPVNNGFVNCFIGQKSGENLNCQYCENFFLWKKNVSASGEIGADLVYVLNPTLDFTKIEFTDVTSSLPQNLKTFFGDKHAYQITGFKSEFGCIRKFSMK